MTKIKEILKERLELKQINIVSADAGLIVLEKQRDSEDFFYKDLIFIDATYDFKVYRSAKDE